MTRRTYAALHRLFGALFGAFFVIVGLTGSVLEWRPEIDAALDPAAYRTTSATFDIGFDRAVAAARHADARGTPTGVSPPLANAYATQRVYAVYMLHGRDTTTVTVDPATGRVLRLLPPHAHLSAWLYDLHTALLLQGVGKNVVACVGIALVCACALGLILWPGWKVARAGLSFNAGSLRRQAYDAHKIAGIGSVLFLLLIGATGVAMTWSAATNGLVTRVIKTGVPFDAPAVAVPRRGTRLSLDAQRRLGARLMPLTQLAYLDIPKDAASSVLQARRARTDVDRSFGSSSLYLDPYTGRSVGSVRLYRDPLRDWYSWAYALHVGHLWLNLAPRIAATIAGLMPAFLLATGLFVWCSRTTAARRPRGQPKRELTGVPSPTR